MKKTNARKKKSFVFRNSFFLHKLNPVRIERAIKKIGFINEAKIRTNKPHATKILLLNESKNIAITMISSSKKTKLIELLKKRCVGENKSTIELKKAIFASE